MLKHYITHKTLFKSLKYSIVVAIAYFEWWASFLIGFRIYRILGYCISRGVALVGGNEYRTWNFNKLMGKFESMHEPRNAVVVSLEDLKHCRFLGSPA